MGEAKELEKNRATPAETRRIFLVNSISIIKDGFMEQGGYLISRTVDYELLLS